MMARKRGPTLEELFGIFTQPEPVEVPSYVEIAADDVPQPYHDLLVHEHHMTVTVERFHGCPVKLRVLRHVALDHHYARMILLEREATGEVVQFGIARVDLDCCSEPVRAEILARRAPLGRILIEHGVLRHIDPTAYLRITPTAAMIEWFGMTRPEPLYGRLAIIFYEGQPAVDLLEVVRHEPPWPARPPK